MGVRGTKMNEQEKTIAPVGKTPNNGGGRVRVALLASSLVVLGVLAYIALQRNDRGAKTGPEPEPVTHEVVPAETPIPRPGVAMIPVPPPIRPATTTAPTPALPAQPVSAEMRALVEQLVKPQAAGGVLTPEQAATWRTNLSQLVQQGAAGLPAIREFLEKNVDLDFGQPGRQMLGYGTARLALLDALAQIGGTEALGIMSGVLQSTADPREIAVLARNFEQLDPSAHRQEVLDATRATLAMASDGKLADRDMAPLFEILQTYGDASVTEDLRKSAGKWNYYSMVALAQLPDGAGIPELIKIVQGEGSNASGARVPAIEMLAQMAGESETARNVLIEQARQNALTAYNWATIESILAGDRVGYQDSAYDTGSNTRLNEVKRTHISSGNQNFYSAPPPEGLTAEQASAQSALIDQLVAVTKDPSGIQVLERARQLLARRSAQVAKSGSNP